MFKALLARHRSLGVVGSLLGAMAIILGLAAPAYASGSDQGPTGGNNTSQNYDIYQGGSNTTYLMMEGLSTLFNESPGCDLATSGGTQPLDYGCPGINDAGGTLSSESNNPTDSAAGVGENGFTPYANENPFNDILIEEPALGSSNGIGELEKQVGHAPQTTVTVPDVTVTGGSPTITATGTGASTFAGVTTGWYVVNSGGAQDIATGTTVTVNSDTSITLSANATGSSVGEFSVTFSSATSGANVAPLDAARSSRAPNLNANGCSSCDDKGLNFVAYAMDGVSWFHWTKIGTTATPSANVTNITTADLTSIWENDLSCTVSGTTYTENWICLGGTNAPIDLYIAQSGSGTESTWATLLGLTGTFPYGGENASHVIFENETESITNNGDENNAIFLFSYGKFNTVCDASAGYCGTEPTGWTGGTIALGDINGVPVNEGTINAQLPGFRPPVVDNVTVASGGKKLTLASGSFPATVGVGDVVTDSDSAIPPDTVVTKVSNDHKVKLNNAATASDSTDTITFTPPVFAGDRLLYNVYSDGLNSSIPVSSDAALNAVSEDGFICKPSTSSDIDPNTGNNYRAEIESVISSNGFFPLPLEVETGTYTLNGNTYGGASIANPAWNELGGSAYASSVETGQPYNFPTADTDTDSSAVSGSYTINGSSVTATASAPVGYCLVLSTDGNTTS